LADISPTTIPEELVEAVLEVIRKRLGSMPDAERRALVEDIHHPMHEHEPLKRCRDRDFTKSGLEKFK
jgi:hypothetical protein